MKNRNIIQALEADHSASVERLFRRHFLPTENHYESELPPLKLCYLVEDYEEFEKARSRDIIKFDPELRIN